MDTTIPLCSHRMWPLFTPLVTPPGPAQFPPQENCFENPSTTSPPSNPTYAPSTTISAFMSPDPAAAHPPTPANTLTLGDGTSAPITSKVEVESLPGTMYMAIGLNFFIELRSPEEVMTAAGDRVDFLTDKIERKQKDIDVVAVDVRAVLANLEEVGGEMRERGE